MFLEKTIKTNNSLVQCAFDLHQNGIISPDTYILDLDMIRRNAQMMLDEARAQGVKLFFMTKQIGRNPLVAKMLMEMGFDGAVVVDFREAETMIAHGIPIGNVGHIVQIPKQKLKRIIASEPYTITVYSLEKLGEINEVSKELGCIQQVTLRVIGENDFLYPGQYGGFKLNELKDIEEKAKAFEHIEISGVTSFPCFLYNEENQDVYPTNNLESVMEAKNILEGLGLRIIHVNLPSSTATRTIRGIKAAGGTHGEPGHGLTGTTPYHRDHEGSEIPAMVYVSEVSHNLEGLSYAYGGGSYARSHVGKAVVGTTVENMRLAEVIAPPADNIDYYITLVGNQKVSDTVVMAFRSQIFVTRSHVAVVKGISTGVYEIAGIYDSQGRKLTEGTN